MPKCSIYSNNSRQHTKQCAYPEKIFIIPAIMISTIVFDHLSEALPHIDIDGEFKNNVRSELETVEFHA